MTTDPVWSVAGVDISTIDVDGLVCLPQEEFTLLNGVALNVPSTVVSDESIEGVDIYTEIVSRDEDLTGDGVSDVVLNVACNISGGNAVVAGGLIVVDVATGAPTC